MMCRVRDYHIIWSLFVVVVLFVLCSVIAAGDWQYPSPCCHSESQILAKIARIIVSRGPKTGSVMISSWCNESLNVCIWKNATQSEQALLVLSKLWQRTGLFRGPKAGSVMMSSWCHKSLNVRIWTNATRSEQAFLFLYKLWQRTGLSRGPKGVARVKIMQPEVLGDRLLPQVRIG